MVALKNLNKVCKTRPVARAVPAQIVCRLLGNTLKPCQLDLICKPCGKNGAWIFYSSIVVGLAIAFFAIFWVLKITRLSKLLDLAARMILPPLKWLSLCFAAAVNFYRNLPF
ncbi:MAG: hypothetical protein EOM80_11610 [Erysipelotrichia bacterium]|nr:hypothetical protein [Erysipelotrichia bacterium]